MNDDLNTLLRTWSPKPHTGADIRAEVWQRIERAEPSRWQGAVDSLFSRFIRTTFASGLVIIAIITGITIGTVASESAQTQAYLNSVAAYRLHQ